MNSPPPPPPPPTSNGFVLQPPPLPPGSLPVLRPTIGFRKSEEFGHVDQEHNTSMFESSRSSAIAPLTPRTKLRRLQWTKIPSTQVAGRSNLWTSADRLVDDYRLDLDRVEQLFAVTPTTASNFTSGYGNGVATPSGGNGGTKYTLHAGREGVWMNRRRLEEVGL